jgi:hypothetical protein
LKLEAQPSPKQGPFIKHYPIILHNFKNNNEESPRVEEELIIHSTILAKPPTKILYKCINTIEMIYDGISLYNISLEWTIRSPTSNTAIPSDLSTMQVVLTVDVFTFEGVEFLVFLKLYKYKLSKDKVTLVSRDPLLWLNTNYTVPSLGIP